MKKEPLMVLLLCLLMFLFVTPLFSQLKNSDAKGTVTLQNGQSVQGFIKIEELSRMNTRINFKATEDASTYIVYDTSQIKGFRLEDGDVFELMRFHAAEMEGDMAVFAKQIVKGRASLYKLIYKTDAVYIVINDTRQYVLQDDKLDNGQSSLDLTEHYFRNTLRAAVPGTAITTDRLERISFREQDFRSIVYDYNKSMGGENIVSTNNEKSTHFIVADVGGMYKNADQRELYVQVMYRIFIPKISRNSSLNIGFHYFNTTYTDITHPAFYPQKNNYKRTLFSIPFLFQQNFLNKQIRPYVFAGFTGSYYKIVDQNGVNQLQDGFQNNIGIGLAAGGGIEASLYKGFFVKGEYRYEIFSHLVLAGVGYIFSGSKK